LVEYKKFKDAAARLQVLEVRQEAVFPRAPGRLVFEVEETGSRAQASIFDLVGAVNIILKRFNEREDLRDIFEDKWSVSEKIQLIMQTISERAALRFSELFQNAGSRSEIVVTFLALLELIRLKQIVAVQAEAFGEIDICRVSASAEGAVSGPGEQPADPTGAEPHTSGAAPHPPAEEPEPPPSQDSLTA
jgi:segregation and condensation protein A